MISTEAPAVEKSTAKDGRSGGHSGQKSASWLGAVHRGIDFFTSLRLTVACLCLGILLVFVGTIAQVDEGLYSAQNRFFRSLLIWWSPKGADWRMPIFPGGYLIGAVLLLNLLAAHAKRFKFTKKKIGIFIIHAGIVLLLLGQFATDILSTESQMQLTEGETKNYSVDFKANELAIIDTSDPQLDLVISVPDWLLARKSEIHDAKLPFAIRVKQYWPNCQLMERPGEGSVKPEATDGLLKNYHVLPQATATDTEHRNVPGAVVELVSDKGPIGSWLVYAGVSTKQAVVLAGKSFDLSFRFTRYYHPFKVTLLKATHEKYKGTDIPKNFASRVRVENPSRNEARETMIYMNNPLRYAGLTFFQYQMAADEMLLRKGERPSSTFQVVRNPSWLTPYLSCIMVALGLIVQFMSHLIGFTRKRRTA